MKCGICGKKVDKVWVCQECGIRFCKNCGEPEREMCELCLQFEEAQKNNEAIDT